MGIREHCVGARTYICTILTSSKCLFQHIHSTDEDFAVCDIKLN